MRGYRWASLALLGVVGVVFATPARAQQVELKPAQKVKRDKYLITAEEIAERAELRDGYDVVKVLRNQWLRVTRGSGTALSASDPTSTSTKVPTACAHDPSTCEAPMRDPPGEASRRRARCSTSTTSSRTAWRICGRYARRRSRRSAT